ncbi:putative GNAT family acetyltransferase [Aspergillus taichungensis]|uniref:Putative GNAT family acetyltransferase n=1 Tax=Aspergillus taichungensis TaxID=482145 RepID=A0A2J5I9B0_9EURO|nr:putative GNAT family acetyltransferase [Aspergillus taichungensis]
MEETAKAESFRIIPAETPAHITATKALFTAYAEWLNLDLTFQGFTEELQSLPGKYSAPQGEILLAYSTTEPDQPLGCVAVRPLLTKPDVDVDANANASATATCCEMKRLFVSPEARGMGLGKALVDAIVQRARGLGYREMRLDTLPMMAGAIGLYRRAGFGEIAAYYETPLEGTLFLGLDMS